MVVGSVQSGKTANYIGLLTKAADYGYKIIIIIAGINETLRQQTQYRVNEGFVSEDMSRFKSIGIQKRGITRDHKSFLKPRSYTTESRTSIQEMRAFMEQLITKSRDLQFL